MANQDFDTLIVNPLERPLSSDLDALQSQLNRTIRDTFSPYFSGKSGFIGTGFQPVATGGGALAVTLSAGIGFQATSNSESNLNGVAGLNDLSTYKPLLLSSSRSIAVPGVPSSGNCRRDIICVQWDRSFATSLAYMWNAGTNTFSANSVNKNMSFDLASAGVQEIAAGSPDLAVQPIVYKLGQEIPYSNEDSFLYAPIAVVPTGYVPVAILNVNSTSTELTASDVIDYRTLLLQYGTYSVSVGVSVTEALASIAGGFSNLPASGKVGVLYTPGQQRIRFCFFAGNLSSYAYRIGRRGFDLVAQEGAYTIIDVPPKKIEIDPWGVASVKAGFAVADKFIRDSLNGTDTSLFNVVNPIDVAVGQPYIAMDAYFGIQTISSFGEQPRINLVKLPYDTTLLDSLTYTFSAQADITAL